MAVGAVVRLVVLQVYGDISVFEKAQGTPIKALVGGDFTLQSSDGPILLSDYRGKAVVLYFGYTFCPDVCPTSLSLIAQAFSALTPEELGHVKGLFVSVDPERDTVDALKTYAIFFHPNIVGVSGTPEQVATVARNYGVYYMKQKPDSYDLYSVDHSAFTYIIGTDGKVAATLPHGTSASEIIKTIRDQINLQKVN